MCVLNTPSTKIKAMNDPNSRKRKNSSFQISISAEKGPFQKAIFFPTIIFPGIFVSFRESMFNQLV